MILIIKIFLMLIPVATLAFLIHAFKKQDKNFSYVVMLKALLLYIPIVIMVYYGIINLSFIKDKIDGSVTIFFDEYIIFLSSCSISTIITIPITVILDKIEEKKLIEKLEAKFTYDKFDYYRELLDDIPPAMLAAIYEENPNVDDQITATLIYLKNKKIIDENNSLIDKEAKLKKHELRLIQLIDNKNTYEMKNFHNEFKRLVIEDLNDAGYLTENKQDRFIRTKFMEAISGSLILVQLVTISALYTVTSLQILTFASYFICFLPLPLYQIAIKKNFYRNEKGIEIKAKLEGLKKYLTDFTNVNDKSIEEIKLYDEYILYAIIFNIKGKLDSESKEVYTKLNKEKNKKIRFYIPKDKTQIIIELFFLAVTYFAIEAGAVQMIKDGEGIGLVLLIQIFPIVFTVLVVSQFITKE